MRHDPERFVTFVLGTFMFAYWLGLALQTARVWKRIGRCPIPALTEGGAANTLHAAAAWLWPVPVLSWASCPSCLRGLPRIPPLENWPVRLLGLLALCLSAAMLVTAGAELGDSWRMGVEQDAPVRLSRTGIYGSIRHPMYGGGWLALFGMFLLAPNLLFAMLWCAGSSLVIVLAEREDRELEERLGDEFRDYASRTGRFFPLLR